MIQGSNSPMMTSNSVVVKKSDMFTHDPENTIPVSDPTMTQPVVGSGKVVSMAITLRFLFAFNWWFRAINFAVRKGHLIRGQLIRFTVHTCFCIAANRKLIALSGFNPSLEEDQYWTGSTWSTCVHTCKIGGSDLARAIELPLGGSCVNTLYLYTSSMPSGNPVTTSRS